MQAKGCKANRHIDTYHRSSIARRITDLSANQAHTSLKSYPRWPCFFPARIPGESHRVIFCNTFESSCEPSKWFRKPVPNFSSPRKGKSGLTHRALPGMTRSSGPPIHATNRSVVGSGPIRCPGKSRPSRYRMNVVLPTLY